jgi:F-box protein 11
VYRVTRADFFGQPPNARAWTERVYSNEVRVELYSKGNLEGFSLIIKNLVYSFSDKKFRIEAIVGDDQRQNLEKSYRNHHYYQWGKPVAIINFVSSETQKETNCTGFLLTPTLLMTNEHCINQDWQLPSAEVIFGFESDSPRQTKSKIFEIADLNFDLDYVVLRLSSPVNSWSLVAIEDKKVSENQHLVVIQHSGGRPKLIAARDCSVLVTDAMGRTTGITDFYHKCDTEGGGSGSPVMDLQTGKVIGLHHLEQFSIAFSLAQCCFCLIYGLFS